VVPRFVGYLLGGVAACLEDTIRSGDALLPVGIRGGTRSGENAEMSLLGPIANTTKIPIHIIDTIRNIFLMKAVLCIERREHNSKRSDHHPEVPCDGRVTAAGWPHNPFWDFGFITYFGIFGATSSLPW